MRWFLSLFLFAILFMPVAVFADARTGKCSDGESAVKNKTEVGIFLQGVCNECWDAGNCSMTDFLTVIANAGNFILSIIAGLVFLVYIMGGFFWIIAHGDKSMVEKGKKWIKNATVGLIIVLVAYTGVVALRSAVIGEGISQGYVICSGVDTDGQPCALNSICGGFSCVSSCEAIEGNICTDAATADTLIDAKKYTCTTGAATCQEATQQCCTPVPAATP